jgi:hypothetical protein
MDGCVAACGRGRVYLPRRVVASNAQVQVHPAALEFDLIVILG